MSGQNDSAEAKKALVALGWGNGATAFANSGGRCEYCRRDILFDRLSYGCSASDHLLPKSAYPHLEAHEGNIVASCGLCNSVKRSHDVLEKDGRPATTEVARQILETNRSGLVASARTHIEERMRDYDTSWEKVKQALFPDR